METLATEHEISLQLNAGAVDAKSGVITGATVAQAGVDAIGKFVMLDAAGQITRDPDQMKKKLGVVTDDETLDTIMAAASNAGGVLKIRSDHDDSLGARAGYAKNFVKIPAQNSGGKTSPARITADLYLASSYRDRDIVLETAQNTPALIGLSIDMLPSFEIKGDRAVMRIEELYAVDIVDAGAITHDGLFLSRTVDKTPRVKTSSTKPDPLLKMATEDKKPLTIEDCMSAITQLTSGMTKLAESVAAMGKASAVPEQLSAQLKTLTEGMSAQNETLLTLKKEQGALGLKLGVGGGSGGGDESERVRLAAEQAEKDKNAKGKNYLQLMADYHIAANGKLSKSDAHRHIQATQAEKYREYQKGLGVYDEARDPRRMTA